MTQRKAELRTRLVDSRTALHPHRRRQADRSLCAHLLRLLDDRDYVDIAAFIAFRGEPDLSEALGAISEAGRRVWLPVVRDSAMRFRRWRPGTSMSRNRFGIPEPVGGDERDPQRLELVLAPLVAFAIPEAGPVAGRRGLRTCSRSTACRPTLGTCRWRAC